jgi:hypothetical protein
MAKKKNENENTPVKRKPVRGLEEQQAQAQSKAQQVQKKTGSDNPPQHERMTEQPKHADTMQQRDRPPMQQHRHGGLLSSQEMQKQAPGLEDMLIEIKYDPGQDPEADDYGRIGPIDDMACEKAMEDCQKYQDGKRVLETRIIENQQWWRQRQWDLNTDGSVSSINANDPRPVSAWMLNSLANKHADIMDNYPTTAVLPREQSDEEDAMMLSKIIPVIMERSRFKKTYSTNAWYKIKYGTSVYMTGWDSCAENGLGDIKIENVDLLNIFWEPGITDIQDSRNVFTVTLVDNEVLKEQYPFLADSVGQGDFTLSKYVQDDNVDDTEKTAVFDWYYKRRIGSREVLHYAKFAAGHLIFASENVAQYAERGYYDHGKYPFEFDVMFPIDGQLCGFGYIDIMKDPQMYIDKLNQIVMKNAQICGKVRYFVNDQSGLNEEEFTDLSKDIVHVTRTMDNTKLQQIQVNSLQGFIVNHQQARIDELKETSGNRDFSQGSTAAGVTAASAIAALQEAGSKLSRDMIQESYQCYESIAYTVLELIRQFYDEPRCFRILMPPKQLQMQEQMQDPNAVPQQGQPMQQMPPQMDGQPQQMPGEPQQPPQQDAQYVAYDNTHIKDWNKEDMSRRAIGMRPILGDDETRRVPIFDIEISAQKQNPFNQLSQNETAKELYNLGFFNPQQADQSLIALDMMQFEGKEKVVQKISQNQQLMQQMQQLQQQNAQMAQILQAQQQGMMPGQDMQGAPQDAQQPQDAGLQPTPKPTGEPGGGQGSSRIDTLVRKKRESAQQQANPFKGGK